VLWIHEWSQVGDAVRRSPHQFHTSPVFHCSYFVH
jgi:hypothetical protein